VIQLDEWDCLDLLTEFRTVLVPERGWREVEDHGPDALMNPGLPVRRPRVVSSDDAPVKALIRAPVLDLRELAAPSAG